MCHRDLKPEQPDHTSFPPPPPAFPFPEICFLGELQGAHFRGRLWTGRKGIGRGSLCVLSGGSLEDRRLLVAQKDCQYLFITLSNVDH